MPANPFDEFDSQTTANPFDEFDEKPVDKGKQQGYVAAQAKSGALTTASLPVFAAEQVGSPLFTSPEEVAVLKGSEQEKRLAARKPEDISWFEKLFSSKHPEEPLAGTVLGRARLGLWKEAEDQMANLTPEAQEVAKKEWLTLDTDKAAWLSPTRVAGDLAGSASSFAVGGAAAVAGKKAYMTAFMEAMASGAPQKVARAAGLRAASAMSGVVAGGGEGALGFVQGAQGMQQEIMKMPTEDLIKIPEYQKLLEEGHYTPEAARQILASRMGFRSGTASAIGDFAVGEVGGQMMGKVINEAGGRLARLGKGFLSEAIPEGGQSGLEQIGQNITEQQAGMDTPTFKGVPEQVAGGMVVGGIMGGGTNLVMGQNAKTREDKEKKALEDSAKRAEVEADTGMAPSQMAALDNVQKANPPKLTPLQQSIAAVAGAAQLDPNTVLAISSLETGGTFNPTIKNNKSTAHGLFQMLDGTWDQMGGGDRNDPQTQIVNGVKNLAQTSAAMAQKIGRVPNATELYLGQLLGANGAAKVLQADPDASILDVVKTYDPANAEAIVNNNGMKGLTVKEAIASWDGKLNAHMTKLGLNPVANTAHNATSNKSEDLAGDPMDELDAAIAEQDKQPLTDKEVQDARREEEVLHTQEMNDNPDEGAIDAAIHAQQNGLQEGKTAEEQAQNPVLPVHLEDAETMLRMSIGHFNVSFDSPIDKAAFQVGKKVPPPHINDWLKFLMDATDTTEEEARNYGHDVYKNAVAMAKEHGQVEKGKTGAIRMANTQAGQFNEGFVTNDELATRDKYHNSNDSSPLTRTPILAATNPKHVGQVLRDIKPGAGEVAAVSYNNNVAPPEYVKAVQQTLESWVKQFAPTMRLIASFRTDAQPGQPKGNVETAWFIPRKAFGNGIYQINARPLYNWGSESGSKNSTTQAKAAYSLAHEFGHALVEHEFFSGLDQKDQHFLRNLGPWQYVPEDMLNRLPADKAAVLREYNVKKRMGANNQVSAVDWATMWLSPWKLAHGFGKGQGMASFLNKFFGEGFMRTATAHKVAQAFHDRGDMLSIHEYLAEQMSKYAFSKNLFKDTALGSENFFEGVLKKLRTFFRGLKATKAVAPGTEFTAWVDSLTKMNQMTEGQSTPKARKTEEPVVKGQGAQQSPKVQPDQLSKTPKKKDLRKPPPSKTVVTPIGEEAPIVPAAPEQSQYVQDAVGGVSAEQQAADDFHNTTMAFLIKTNPKRFQALQALIDSGQLMEYRSQVSEFFDDDTMDNVRFDALDPGDAPYVEALHPMKKLNPAGLKGWLSEGLKVMQDGKYKVLTMRQMAHLNPTNGGLQMVNDAMTQHNSIKAQLEEEASQYAQAWSKMPKEQKGKMEKAMWDEYDSDTHWFKRTTINGKTRFEASDQVREYAKKNGLDEATVNVWLGTKNTYVKHMRMTQRVLRDKAAKEYAGKPALLRRKSKEISDIFSDIIDKPFLPQTRFGQFALKVTAPGGNIVHLEFFETEKERNEHMPKLQAAVDKGHEVAAYTYSKTSAILRTIPPQLLSQYAAELQLTREQRAEIREMIEVTESNPQLRRYSARLATVTGYGKNLLRSYADFMWHSSGNIAKLNAVPKMKEGLMMINQNLRALENDPAAHAELTKVRDFTQGYINHFMWPAESFVKVRSFVVTKQLWGNVKTALANLNALANVWAIMSTREGMVKGTTLTGKIALQQAKENINRISQFVMRGPKNHYKDMPPEMRSALEWASQTGVIDQTFAAQLANLGSMSSLYRMSPAGSPIGRQIMWAGMLPQHAIENYTRRVTFLASYTSFRNQGMSEAKARKAAADDTLLIQGDSSLANRPEFMRGKAALFTIYYGYMQNMLFLMSGAYEKGNRAREASPRSKFASETVKLWMAYAVMGGLMGLPGAEDLEAIMSLIAQKMFGRNFKLTDYAYKVAKHISENAAEFGLDLNPRSIVHGALSDVTMLGLLPGTDWSSSVSLGKAVPGVADLGELGVKGGGYKFLIGAMGPMGRELDSIIRVSSDDVSMGKKFQMLAPSGVANVARAWMEYNAGVTYPSGAKVTRDIDTGEVRDQTTGELLFHAMGMTPTVQSANREVFYAQKEAEHYWINARNVLMSQYFDATLAKDREAVADVKANIQEYNENAPGGMKITPQDVARSLKSKNTRRIKEEAGRPVNKRSTAIYNEVADDYRGDLSPVAPAPTGNSMFGSGF